MKNIKYWIITIIIAAVTFGIGFMTGDASAVGRLNKQVSANVDKENSTSSKPAKSDKKDTKIYKPNDEVAEKAWKLKLISAKEANTIKGTDTIDTQKAQGKFIIVKMQLTNISSAAAEYGDYQFALGNMKSKATYNLDDDVTLAADQIETIAKENKKFCLAIDDVNPNMPKYTYLVFDVPKDFSISDGLLMHANGSKTPTSIYLK